jgi:hypothetical protein
LGASDVGKITLEDLQLMKAHEREIADKLNNGLKFKTATKEDKRKVTTDATVYRIEFPKMSEEKALALFNRLHSFCQYHKEEYQDTYICFGYSEHKSWTPFSMVTTPKGGKPHKFFNACEDYKRSPHVHFYTVGKQAHKIATKVYKNQCKQIKLKSAKDVIRSQKVFCPQYVEWQSTFYNEYGELQEHIFDDDLLDV